MDIDDRLQHAFTAWSEARMLLGRLRAQRPSRGQMAASPEAADLARRIAEQERTCDQRFTELVAIAEERARILGLE